MTIRSWVDPVSLTDAHRYFTAIPKTLAGGKFWRFGFLHVRPGKRRRNRQVSAY